MDELQADLLAMVAGAADGLVARGATFEQVRTRALGLISGPPRWRLAGLGPADVVQVPRMTEQWYCCAEPIELTPNPAERY
jgi:hypothetical protein